MVTRRGSFGAHEPNNRLKVDPALRDRKVQYSSKNVSIGFVRACAKLVAVSVGAITIALINSASRPQRACVDSDGKVTNPENCYSSTSSSHSYPYRWHYGGRGYRIGSIATGGSWTAPEGVSSFSDAGSTRRGVFGSSGWHFSGLS